MMVLLVQIAPLSTLVELVLRLVLLSGELRSLMLLLDFLDDFLLGFLASSASFCCCCCAILFGVSSRAGDLDVEWLDACELFIATIRSIANCSNFDNF